MVAPTAEFISGGKLAAQPIYLVDVNGNPISNTNLQMVTAVGPTASGTADSGSNPLKIGGVASTNSPSQVAVGQMIQAWLGRNGQVVVALADINGATATMNSPGDAQGTQSGPATASQTLVYNGSNWDRWRSDQTGEGRVSLYGKNSTPGDIAVSVNSAGDVKTAGDFTEQASLSAGSLNADLVPSTDVSAYKSFSIQINSNAYVGTLTFQGSNDNVTWNSVLVAASDGSGATSSITTTSVLYYGSVTFRYLRVRMTAYTSGTAQGTLELYTHVAFTNFVSSRQTGTYTVQPGNTQNTTPWLFAGPTNNAVQAANTAVNVVIKGSAGTLWNAIVTATGTAGLDIFDNASTNSGTKLLSIPANAAIGTLYSFAGGQPATNGIVSAGVTNCPGVTFGYR